MGPGGGDGRRHFGGNTPIVFEIVYKEPEYVFRGDDSWMLGCTYVLSQLPIFHPVLPSVGPSSVLCFPI